MRLLRSLNGLYFMRLRTSPCECSLNYLTAPPIPLSALIWLPHNLQPCTLSPLMQHSLKLWDTVGYSGNLMSPFLPLQQPSIPIRLCPTGIHLLVVHPRVHRGSPPPFILHPPGPLFRTLMSHHLWNFFDMPNYTIGYSC